MVPEEVAEEGEVEVVEQEGIGLVAVNQTPRAAMPLPLAAARGVYGSYGSGLDDTGLGEGAYDAAEER